MVDRFEVGLGEESNAISCQSPVALGLLPAVALAIAIELRYRVALRSQIVLQLLLPRIVERADPQRFSPQTHLPLLCRPRVHLSSGCGICVGRRGTEARSAAELG